MISRAVLLGAVAVSAAAGCADDSTVSGTAASPAPTTQELSDSTSTSTPSASASALEGSRCGTVPGPEGALTVVVFAGGEAECSAAMPVAQAYAPSIASGAAQTVQGWECGPSQIRGVLSRCTRGDEAFGFVVE